MNQICPSKICTGCALCAAQCPTGCITMQPNVMGHLYPVIDNEKCIDCKLCQRKCPAISSLAVNTPTNAYVAWAKDNEEYKTSTSGGVAAVLSNLIISMGGVVYGCAMLPNIEVRHIRIDNHKDLYKLKGSKYVQSNIKDIIPVLKTDVRQGIPVLFIGTPCQIAAIKKIYNNIPDNLFLVDIICHGTPSLISLNRHIKKVAPSESYSDIRFRDNSGYVLTVNNETKSIYYCNLFRERFKDLYINSFFDGFSYRDSCYSCNYAKKQRISDITIGDFWGLGARESAENIPGHEYGCSAILLNTDKGVVLLDKVKSQLNIFERPVEECIAGNEQLRHPKVVSPRIKVYRFLNRYIYFPGAYYLVNIDLVLKHKIRNIFKK